MELMDEKLYRFYLELKGPDAGAWNTSPQCLYTEVATRDYIRKKFELVEGIHVCNVGIGTGDWDDFLGYWLNHHGILTSIEIDQDICDLFRYRQAKEGHPNPAKVICKSIFDESLPQSEFDIITLIGSAINEIGELERCLDACFRLLKKEGHFMLMAHRERTPFEMVEQYLSVKDYLLVDQKLYLEFAEYPFYICNIKKSLA